MGLFSFIKDVGTNVFGGKDSIETTALDSAALHNYLVGLGFDLSDVRFSIEGHKVVLGGTAPTHELKEKIIVAIGNAKGVEHVEDNMKVTAGSDVSAPESKFYTVKAGDTLSGIAQKEYGNANKYHQIFEANKPMLSHPDKIFVGQVLRLPIVGNA